jgi:cytosine permease
MSAKEAVLEHNDYAREPVPQEKTRGWVSTGLVYIGCAICLSAFLMGGILAMGMTLSNAIIATLLGTLVLAVITFFCSKVGTYTHLSTAMICKFTFGLKGALLVAVLYAMCAWGWFGVQVGLFGDTVGSMINMMFGIEVAPIVIKIFMLAGGLLMMSSAIMGYRAIELLSIIAVPLIAILMILSLFKVLQGHTFKELQGAHISTPLGMGAGISMVAGSFMAGAVGAPDVIRYARNFKQSALAAIFGFIIGFGSTVIIAAICAKAVGDANIVNVMVTLGWGFFGMIVLILAQWTSNDNNIYSASLGFSIVLEKVSKPRLAILTGVIGTVLAVLGISNHLIPFFSILGVFTPPIGGVYVVDFFLDNHRYDFDRLGSTKNVRWESVVSWVLGTAVGFMTNAKGAAGFGLFSITTVPAIDAFLVSAVAQLIFVLASRNKKQA